MGDHEHKEYVERYWGIESSVPQTVLEFSRAGLLLLRPGRQPCRKPMRSDAVALPLLEALLFPAMQAQMREATQLHWVPKDVLIDQVINPDCMDKTDSFKKALRSLRGFLGAHDLGAVVCSGDGMYAYVPPEGVRVIVRRR